MPRNISFALTTEQIRKKTKTVTRRFGWNFLKPGTVLCAVEKGMGLKKGESVKKLGMIRVLSVRREPLDRITHDDCVKEGFPDMSPQEFIRMIMTHYKIKNHSVLINRIEFEYL